MPSSNARAYFHPDPNQIYLDAGTYGLAPRPAIDATLTALKGWESGTADFIRDWEGAGERARGLFARLIGATTEEIALVPTVSVGVGTVAASIPEGAEVLIPQEEFTSVALPFYAAAEGRGVTIREVPYPDLASAIQPSTTLVALSLTRAQSGETADLGPIVAAATANGARVLLDTTHSTPFVSVKEHLAGIDYLVCHGYKHLLLPRGVGFLYVRRDRWDDLLPYFGNWRSAGRSYGGPMTLAPDASRFDVSLAWHAWVGAVPALELIVEWNEDGTIAAAKRLANRLARGLELPEPGGSLVCVKVDDAEKVAAALDVAGLRCAARGSYIRLTPHVYNTEEEIDRAITIVNNALSMG
ncbi:MAG: aminotransferase class V-fold PLP-dependent enzyme [Thermomicrobiales bacterium]|nr:aminotransferase class V-fold PLP-dependent enzyme [Thermomicrobiales bacterium]